MDLADALDLGDREHVAFVGAGGKKTAMTHLVSCAGERGFRAGYTTTTHMPPPAEVPLIVRPDDELQQALESASPPVAFASDRVMEPDRADQKVRGHAPRTLDELFTAELFDWLLVKADGARRREFKAPGPEEPVIPATSTHVVPVASVRAVGRPLDAETVHRPERVAAITGLEPGDDITSEAVGSVLASDAGGCKSIPAGARVTPLVNKADTRALSETARDVLLAVLDGTDRFDRGIVASFERGEFELVE